MDTTETHQSPVKVDSGADGNVIKDEMEEVNENRDLHVDVSEVMIEQPVEIKMYRCLKEKNYQGLIDLVRHEGGDVNHRFIETSVDLPQRGWTALHFACQKDKVELLDTLLDLGADPSLADMKGNTPLHVACKLGYYRSCQCILKRNNLVNDKQNLQGLTPLMKAIFRFDTAFKEKDYERTINLLIETGCDVNCTPKSNMSPLHVVAGKWKSVKMVQKLLQAGADVNANTGTSSPLMTALSRPRVDTATVLALIDAGANVNYQNPSLKSVLHIAVSKSEDQCVERLLAAGADPNVEDGDGNSPLWIAVSENDIKISPVLIQYGSDVNFRNAKYRMSLLSKAVLNRNKNMVELLLKHKADVDSLTALGASALHYAVDEGDLDIIKILLRKNPDMENYSLFRNLYNPQNVFQIALSRGDSSVIELLLMAGMPAPFYRIKYKRLPNIVQNDEELMEWINNYLFNPQSLQHLCRLEIRRHYKTELGTVVTFLTKENLIPKRVADTILMKDILDDDFSVDVDAFL